MLFVISRAGPRETLGLMTNRIQTLFGRFRSLISRIWSRGSSGNHGDDSAFGVQDQFLVVEDYEPAPYEGRVLLFRSQLHQTGRFRDPELGWGKLVRGRLDVQETPGDHHSMFVEPAVQVVARKLAESLNQDILSHPD